MIAKGIENAFVELLGNGFDLVQASLGDNPRSEDLKGVTTACAVELAYLAVEGFSESVCDAEVPPVEDLGVPVLEGGRDRLEMGLQFIGEVGFPVGVHLFSCGAILSRPDVHEALFRLKSKTKDRAEFNQLQQRLLLALRQIEVPGEEDVFVLLDTPFLSLGEFTDGLDANPGHDLVGHLLDVKAVNDHLGTRESNSTGVFVRLPHIDTNQLDLLAVQGKQKCGDFGFCPSGEHFNEGLFPQVGEDSSRGSDVDFVDSKNLRRLELVSLPQILNMGAEHVADRLLGDSRTSGNVRELLPVALLSDEFSQPRRHVVIWMHGLHRLFKGSSAVAAFEAFTLDLQGYSLPMDGRVMEKLSPRPVRVETGEQALTLQAGGWFKVGLDGDTHVIINGLGFYDGKSYEIQ